MSQSDTKNDTPPVQTNSSGSKAQQSKANASSMPAPTVTTSSSPSEGDAVTTSGTVGVQNNPVLVEAVTGQDDPLEAANTQDHDDPGTVEVFEKVKKGIQNPMFVKSAVKDKKTGGFLANLDLSAICGSGSSDIIPDPAGSNSLPIRVPIVPAACYAITEVDTEVLPDNPLGFGYN